MIVSRERTRRQDVRARSWVRNCGFLLPERRTDGLIQVTYAGARWPERIPSRGRPDPGYDAIGDVLFRIQEDFQFMRASTTAGFRIGMGLLALLLIGACTDGGQSSGNRGSGHRAVAGSQRYSDGRGGVDRGSQWSLGLRGDEGVVARGSRLSHPCHRSLRIRLRCGWRSLQPRAVGTRPIA